MWGVTVTGEGDVYMYVSACPPCLRSQAHMQWCVFHSDLVQCHVMAYMHA